MYKAMIFQPLACKPAYEIFATRDKAIRALAKQGYEIANNPFTDDWCSEENMEKRGSVVQIKLCHLSQSIETMALCRAVYFCKGWENSRECQAEHDIAKAYGLVVIYEK